MKRSKHPVIILLSVLAIIIFWPVQALAAESIDSERSVSLTLVCQDNGTPLSEVQFDLFLVATADSSGELVPTDTFAPYNVNMQCENDEDWRNLASTLEGYVLRDDICPDDSGTTDTQGRVSFPHQQEKLIPGLYLVLGRQHIQNGRVYEAAPFMVMLPGQDEQSGEWLYDVTAKPKFDSEPVPEASDSITRKVLKIWKDDGHENARPEEIRVQLLQDGRVCDTVKLNADNNWRYTWSDLDSSYKWTVVEQDVEGYTVAVSQEGVTFVITNTYSDAPDAPTGSSIPTNPGQSALPRTGQLWWPVPMLISAGLFLIVIGLLRRRWCQK